MNRNLQKLRCTHPDIHVDRIRTPYQGNRLTISLVSNLFRNIQMCRHRYHVYRQIECCLFVLPVSDHGDYIGNTRAISTMNSRGR